MLNITYCLELAPSDLAVGAEIVSTLIVFADSSVSFVVSSLFTFTFLCLTMEGLAPHDD